MLLVVLNGAEGWRGRVPFAQEEVGRATEYGNVPCPLSINLTSGRSHRWLHPITASLVVSTFKGRNWPS